jgi:hypothetical protein
MDTSKAGITDAGYSISGSVQVLNASTSRKRLSALSWRQPQGGNDPLEIVRSVVLNFNPPAFVSVVDGHVRRQMLLQAVL